MTKYLSFFISLLALNLFGAGLYGPVYYRTNNFTLSPTNVIGSNIFSGTGLVGARGSEGQITVAVDTATTNKFATTNWVTDQLASIGLHIYSTGVTNAGALAGRTNNWQGWDTPVTTVATNTVQESSINDYIRQMVSTNTYTRVESGPISVSVYMFRAGTAGGTVSLHPEFYLYDTVSNTLPYEFTSAPAQTITGSTPILYTWSISAVGVTWTNPVKFVIAWKMDSTPNPGTTINFVSGGSYDSHATFVQNLASASINASQIIQPFTSLAVSGRQSNDVSGLSGNQFWIGSNGVGNFVLSNGVFNLNITGAGAFNQLVIQTNGVTVTTLNSGNWTNTGNIQAAFLRITGESRSSYHRVDNGMGLYTTSQGALLNVANGIWGFRNAAPTDFDRIVLGTNSASGNAKFFPAIAKIAYDAGATPNVIKLTDATDGTNGCLLELKAVPNNLTNTACSADCIRIFAVTNGSGEAEGYTQDELGNQSLITPHATADVMAWFIDDWDDYPAVSKEIQWYLGKVRWHNKSREATLKQWEWAGTNVTALPLAKRTFHYVETFAQYNTRNDLTNGNGLVRWNWGMIQTNQWQASIMARSNWIYEWRAETNRMILAGETNLPAFDPPRLTLPKPMPKWIEDRVAK